MPIALLFDLANYTPADASPVQANFQQIEQFLNTEVITRDGLVAMTAALRLANSTPLNVLDAASKGYVDGLVVPYQPQSAEVLTAESTTTSPYVDLSTVGPSVTMVTGTLVRLAFSYEGTTASTGLMGVGVSGATTFDASLLNPKASASNGTRNAVVMVVPVNAGTNTFTAKYGSPGGVNNCGFSKRSLVVERLN